MLLSSQFCSCSNATTTASASRGPVPVTWDSAAQLMQTCGVCGPCAGYSGVLSGPYCGPHGADIFVSYLKLPPIYVSGGPHTLLHCVFVRFIVFLQKK